MTDLKLRIPFFYFTVSGVSPQKAVVLSIVWAILTLPLTIWLATVLLGAIFGGFGIDGPSWFTSTLILIFFAALTSD